MDMMYIAIAVAVVVAAIFLCHKRREKEVPQGLQVLDADSKTIYNTDTSMTRFVARQKLWGSGTITLADLGYAGTNLFIIMVTSPYYSASYSDPPAITITMTNTSLTWSNVPKNSSEGVPAEVLLGVY